jgi:site-specific recombinase XerD
MRIKLRTKHMALATEDAYLAWARRFILFHNKRHPRDMGRAEVEAFLSHLAVDRNVSASTQNQALAALLFLYRQVLDQDLGWLQDVVRANEPKRLPEVLWPEEIAGILQRLPGRYRLITVLLYGGGLRLKEALRLRVKDVDLDRLQLTVRDGKGFKDRVTILPATAVEPLRIRLAEVQWRTDCCCPRAPSWRNQSAT